ncbi:RNA polymerase II mediator complex subunit [Coniothyrium glycines]
MGDILTQIQDELDMLLHQMAMSLAYIREKAPPSVPPGQQRLDSFAEVEARNAAENNTQNSSNPSQLTQQPPAPAPLSPDEFAKDIKELAQDQVLKHAQIEKLIEHLPGLNRSERDQVDRMKDLQRQLDDLDEEHTQAVKEKEMLLKLVEDKIMGVGRTR